MTNNIDLFWFSGTGNTLFIAMKIEATLNSLGYHCQLLPIERPLPSEMSLNNTIGLIVPVAMQGTFPIVWEFVSQLPEAEGNEIFLIDTLGVYSGGIKGPIKKIVKEKGYNPIGAVEIKMPNFFMRKGTSTRDKMIVLDAEDALKEFCQRLHEGRSNWIDIPIYSDLMSKIFRTQEKGIRWVRKFKKTVTTKCTNCGICVQLCPRKCIDKYSRHIDVDSENCILCQRCLEYCPSNSIEINNRAFIKNGLIGFREFKRALEAGI